MKSLLILFVSLIITFIIGPARAQGTKTFCYIRPGNYKNFTVYIKIDNQSTMTFKTNPNLWVASGNVASHILPNNKSSLPGLLKPHKSLTFQIMGNTLKNAIQCDNHHIYNPVTAVIYGLLEYQNEPALNILMYIRSSYVNSNLPLSHMAVGIFNKPAEHLAFTQHCVINTKVHNIDYHCAVVIYPKRVTQ